MQYISTNIFNNLTNKDEECIESFDKIMALTKNGLVVFSFKSRYLMA